MKIGIEPEVAPKLVDLPSNFQQLLELIELPSTEERIPNETHSIFLLDDSLKLVRIHAQNDFIMY